MPDKENQKRKNVILAGLSNTGKTTLSQALTQSPRTQSKHEYIPTIGLQLELLDTSPENDLSTALLIWDTPGREEYQIIAKSSYSKTDLAVLVYDISKPNSLEALEKIYNNICGHNGKRKIPFIIVGTKRDCVTDSQEVTQQNAEELAKKLNPNEQSPVFEYNAKEGSNIDNIKDALIQLGDFKTPKIRNLEYQALTASNNTLLTQIYNYYIQQGGNPLTAAPRFYENGIFATRPRLASKILETLQGRAKRNSNGASQKTLDKYEEQLKNMSQHF